MEDAHISLVDFDEDTSIFGVFDGHGGKEVAIFVAKHFVEELKKNESYINKKMDAALTETFMKMDEIMQTKEGIAELMQIRVGKHDSDDEEGETTAKLKSNAGCTANVALIYKNNLYVANAGDSRTVLSNIEGVYEMS